MFTYICFFPVLKFNFRYLSQNKKEKGINASLIQEESENKTQNNFDFTSKNSDCRTVHCKFAISPEWEFLTREGYTRHPHLYMLFYLKANPMNYETRPTGIQRGGHIIQQPPGTDFPSRNKSNFLWKGICRENRQYSSAHEGEEEKAR